MKRAAAARCAGRVLGDKRDNEDENENEKENEDEDDRNNVN